MLEIKVKANWQIVEALIGDESMSQALLDIMKPIIEPQLRMREEVGVKEGLKKEYRER